MTSVQMIDDVSRDSQRHVLETEGITVNKRTLLTCIAGTVEKLAPYSFDDRMCSFFLADGTASWKTVKQFQQ